MNRFLILCFFSSFVAFGKSNLNLLIQNSIETQSKESLLQAKKEDITFGNKEANVVITVFDSYSCIHCGRFYKEIFPILDSNYIQTGKLFFVHKEFPLDRWALFATKTVSCSKDKKLQMKNIYRNQEELLQAKDYEEALLGLGSVEKECVKKLENKEITDRIFYYTKVLGINSTPTVYINGVKIRKMTQARLLEKIEEEMKR